MSYRLDCIVSESYHMAWDISPGYLEYSFSLKIHYPDFNQKYFRKKIVVFLDCSVTDRAISVQLQTIT